MSNAPAKVCCVCHKDVANAKRVKDAKGHYYCAACHQDAQHRHPAVAGVGATPKGAGPSTDDADLLPMAATSKPARAPARPQPATAAPAKLPEFCPNCGVKVLPNRRFCVKCNRDVTK